MPWSTRETIRMIAAEVESSRTGRPVSLEAVVA